ncbi:hypothetical protein BC940DRAFT_267299 [Gongronella butleri]|nr:hypothetical protein BC940DRAFT_267299 [Gongronella butleri]
MSLSPGAAPTHLDDTQQIPSAQDDTQCQVCRQQAWKYKCPRCGRRSCSVACVKQHKADQGCSGERSKTHFVGKDAYNEGIMMSDYVYLEDVARISDNVTRHRMQEYKAPKAHNLRSKALFRQARQIGIRYRVLPFGMSKHAANRSNYNAKFKQIFWTMEFLFPDAGNKRVLDHGNLGDRTLRQVLDNLLFTSTPHGRQDYATLRHELRAYVEAGMDAWTIGLKQDRSRINLTPWLDRPVNDCLKHETVIEYPSIVIWLHNAPELAPKKDDVDNSDAKRQDHPSDNDQDDHESDDASSSRRSSISDDDKDVDDQPQKEAKQENEIQMAPAPPSDAANH